MDSAIVILKMRLALCSSVCREKEEACLTVTAAGTTTTTSTSTASLWLGEGKGERESGYSPKTKPASFVAAFLASRLRRPGSKLEQSFPRSLGQGKGEGRSGLSLSYSSVLESFFLLKREKNSFRIFFWMHPAVSDA